MGGKGKKRSIVYLVIAAVIILILLCLPFVVSAQSIQSGASLGVQQVQSFNRVQFHVEWVTDEPAETAIWHFQFGDGTETVLSGVSGSASFSHDYAYSVGGLTTYHPSIDLGNWVDVWTGEIVVDDRPVEETYTVYLPIIMNAGQNPSCSITVSSQNANHVIRRWYTYRTIFRSFRIRPDLARLCLSRRKFHHHDGTFRRGKLFYQGFGRLALGLCLRWGLVRTQIDVFCQFDSCQPLVVSASTPEFLSDMIN